MTHAAEEWLMYQVTHLCKKDTGAIRGDAVSSSLHSDTQRVYTAYVLINTRQAAKCPRLHLYHFCMSAKEMSHFQLQSSPNCRFRLIHTRERFLKITMGLAGDTSTQRGWRYTVHWLKTHAEKCERGSLFIYKNENNKTAVMTSNTVKLTRNVYFGNVRCIKI